MVILAGMSDGDDDDKDDDNGDGVGGVEVDDNDEIDANTLRLSGPFVLCTSGDLKSTAGALRSDIAFWIIVSGNKLSVL